MRNFFYFLILLPFFLGAQQTSTESIDRWQRQAKQVTIIRDQWGIPHIYGKTDADAVFGLLYAQCEDDFQRIEHNYLEKLGRLAEVYGDKELYNDLLIRILLDQEEAKKDYLRSPAWLKKLLQAYADGVNYYLHTHPQVRPLLLNHFEPWWPLLWTDGSIGAISTGGLTVNELASFYGTSPTVSRVVNDEEYEEGDPSGSNGFAIAPKLTKDNQAILYINPHVTFYFRPEVHVSSEQGLNAYGAVTWGQFFVYQGFNEHCGWMHTSSATDVADIYKESVIQNGQQYSYLYEGKSRLLTSKPISLKVKDGQMTQNKVFNIYYTHHGPVMAKRDGQWCTLKSQNRMLAGLVQSWQRTKATSFKQYQKTMRLCANPSNNTVYADAEGNIAYWHGNFIPTRNPNVDWEKPVDGTTKSTEWRGLHKPEETVYSFNPSNGWLQNCNSTPFTVAGEQSPKRELYPKYMAPDGENFRGLNAVRVLKDQQDFTLDKMITIGYDRYLTSFELLIPALIATYDSHKRSYPELAELIHELQAWNFYAHEQSIATTLAVEWGQKILPIIMQSQPEGDQVDQVKAFVNKGDKRTLLTELEKVKKELEQRYGAWKMPWGDINRFQRISSAMAPTFDDQKASMPVSMTSSLWGMLPSYTSRRFPNTTKRYGVNGNSFVCAVQFGPRIKAKSLLAGGQSGDEASPHFADQALMYTQGQFKEVNFYLKDVRKNAQKTYQPGQVEK